MARPGSSKGEQVIALFGEAQRAHRRLGELTHEAEQAATGYGRDFSRGLGRAMLRHLTAGERPGREDVLDLVRAGAGVLLGRAELYAWTQAEEHFGEYEKEVAAAIREIVGDDVVTAACRPPYFHGSVYCLRSLIGGGEKSGLGMPEGPLSGPLASVDVANSRLYLPHEEDANQQWGVEVVNYQGRTQVDLTIAG
jgi:hypothetical protein